MSEFVRTSLDQVLETPISGSRPKGGVNHEGDVPSLGGENVTMDGRLRWYPIKKVSRDFYLSMKRGQLQNYDVLINKDGANTGKSTIYRGSPFSDAAVNEHLFILRGKKNDLDQVYLHYLLQLSSTKIILEQKITGSAQPGLNSAFVKNFPIEIAPLLEQKKIASILTSVDEVIENTQRQIDKLQELKKATMNELLIKGIGHTEFKDSELGRIPKSWEVRKLEEIVRFRQGVQVDLELQTSKPSKGYLPFLRIENYTQGSNDLRYIPEENARNAFVSFEDIVVVRYGATAGFVGRGKSGILANNLFTVTPLDKSLIKPYLYLLLKSSFQYFQDVMAGGAMPALNFGMISSLVKSFPPVGEQNTIVDILSSIDLKIVSLEKKLHQTQSLKKSLMQDLLTGKVRVSVN